MTRHIGIVVNPERNGLVDEVVHRLEAQGCAISLSEPDDVDGLATAVDDLVARGVDAVAAIGGDGSQRTAASRLAGSGTPLAVIPGGTVNLLARVLGVGDLDAAVDAIVGGVTRTIDLGRVDDDLFVLNASSGWDAAVIDAVDDGAKRFGRLGYSMNGIREWWRSEPAPVTVELDGRPWYSGSALTVIVLNVGQRGSESLYLAPSAQIDDGLLDVIVLRRKSVIDLLRAAWSQLRGVDPPAAVAPIGQAARIDVMWVNDVNVQRDGDECPPASNISYSVVPSTLRVIVPADR